MYKISFYVIGLVYLTQRIQCEVTKCCPEQAVLDTIHSCESPKKQITWDVYNIEYIEFSSLLLNCTKPRRTFVDEFYSELNGCIDKDQNGQYVSVSCAKYSTAGVHLMNKCCPTGQSYDQIGRACVQNPDVHSHFKKLFGNTVVVFQNATPDCSEDEVFVEYFSTSHSIQFDGAKINVNGHSLLPDKFCIEDLVNIESNEVSNGDRYFIVRSCRPRSLCEEIPCIRRCCKADQIMYPQPKGKRQCQYHPHKINLRPTFYNVSLPLDAPQKQVLIKGMLHHVCIVLNVHS